MADNGLAQSGVVLDYMAGTFVAPYIRTTDDALGIIRSLFGEIVELPKGMLGYDRSGVVLGSGRVAWSTTRADMGVYLSLPGSALAELRDIFGDIQCFLGDLADFGVKFTRLDFALDDYAGLLDMDVMLDYLERGAYASRFKKVQEYRAVVGGHGRSLLCGSRSSDSYIRIYDKRAEQLDKGAECEHAHWVRVEAEFKGKNAVAMASLVVEKGVVGVVGIVRGLLDFREPSADVNKMRWSPAEWWDRFLDGVARAVLGLPVGKKTIEDVKNWLYRQVAPSLALLVEYERGCVDEIYGLVRSGMGRLRPSQIAMIC